MGKPQQQICPQGWVQESLRLQQPQPPHEPHTHSKPISPHCTGPCKTGP
jgi:hypothetical protein